MEKERGLGWSGEREERSRSESQKEKGGLETRVCRGCHRQAPEAGGCTAEVGVPPSWRLEVQTEAPAGPVSAATSPWCADCRLQPASSQGLSSVRECVS